MYNVIHGISKARFLEVSVFSFFESGFLNISVEYCAFQQFV